MKYSKIKKIISVICAVAIIVPSGIPAINVSAAGTQTPANSERRWFVDDADSSVTVTGSGLHRWSDRPPATLYHQTGIWATVTAESGEPEENAISHTFTGTGASIVINSFNTTTNGNLKVRIKNQQNEIVFEQANISQHTSIAKTNYEAWRKEDLPYGTYIIELVVPKSSKVEFDGFFFFNNQATYTLDDLRGEITMVDRKFTESELATLSSLSKNNIIEAKNNAQQLINGDITDSTIIENAYLKIQEAVSSVERYSLQQIATPMTTTEQQSKVYFSTQEAAGEQAQAYKAFDGNDSTIWHNKWKNTGNEDRNYIESNMNDTSITRKRHWIAIDLTQEKELDKIEYYPRSTSNTSGHILRYKLEFGSEFNTQTGEMTNPVKTVTGKWDDNASVKSVYLDNTTKARYVKLTALTTNDGWVTCRELKLHTKAEVAITNLTNKVAEAQAKINTNDYKGEQLRDVKAAIKAATTLTTEGKRYTQAEVDKALAALTKAMDNQNYFTTTFMDGEKLLYTVVTAKGKTIQMPSNPARPAEALKFIGWYDAVGGKVEDFTTTQTVYAYWSESFYIYLKNGTFADSKENAKPFFYNEKVTVTAEAQKNGQEFRGWYVGDQLVSTNRDYSFYAYTDLTVVAKYADEVSVQPQLETGISMDYVAVLGNNDNTSYSVKFVGHMNLGEGDTIVEQGFVYTGKNDTVLPNDQITADGVVSKPDKLRKVDLLQTVTAKQFSVTVTNIPADKLARGKFFVKTSSGQTYTYSLTASAQTIANSNPTIQ